MNAVPAKFCALNMLDIINFIVDFHIYISIHLSKELEHNIMCLSIQHTSVLSKTIISRVVSISDKREGNKISTHHNTL